MRGEDAFPASHYGSDQETPPRAWGRPHLQRTILVTTRNTPTCVGKTQTKLCVGERRQKHPHVRGEDRGTPYRKSARRETPPRAWGRRPDRGCERGLHGNTPTCVGKTRLPGGSKNACWKHPHVRGEDHMKAGSISGLSETPPRAWGRHQHIVKEREFNHNIHVLRQF